jgi:hypothetical protein
MLICSHLKEPSAKLFTKSAMKHNNFATLAILKPCKERRRRRRKSFPGANLAKDKQNH